jgi:hypothetical protein
MIGRRRSPQSAVRRRVGLGIMLTAAFVVQVTPSLRAVGLQNGAKATDLLICRR